MHDHSCYNLINGLETPTLKVLMVDRRGLDQTSTNLCVLQNHLKGMPHQIPGLIPRVVLGWDLRTYSSSKEAGDADAAGSILAAIENYLRSLKNTNACPQLLTN